MLLVFLAENLFKKAFCKGLKGRVCTFHSVNDQHTEKLTFLITYTQPLAFPLRPAGKPELSLCINNENKISRTFSHTSM